MHESTEDIERVQDLLDRSYAGASGHLRAIHSEERRIRAADLVGRLDGMVLLVLSTATGDGRPLTGPVDGIFHRGAFHFGTNPASVRWRHLTRRPAVSATHLPSEALAVTVHGRAVPVDVSAADPEGLRAVLLAVYLPRYGAQWLEILDGGAYARIEADRMFAADFSALL